jgi:hypothetical protein
MLQNHCKNDFAAFFYSASRACLKNHSLNPRTLLCGIFFPDSASAAESGLNTITIH